MRAAPPVQLPVGAGGWVRRLGDGLCLLAACSIWWALDAHGAPVALSLMVSGVVAWGWGHFHARWWRQMTRLTLQWDGLAWGLRQEGQALETGTLRVAWDAQTLMLAQWQADPPGTARRWLVLSQQRHSEVWHALRLAVWTSPAP